MATTNGEKYETDHVPVSGRGRSMTTVTLTDQQFEALYLQPKIAGKDYSLNKQLGNPTPLGVTSFLLALLPLSMDLMGFQGANATSGVVTLGSFYGCAGIGLYIASIMEWVLGNTFPSVVFGTFGGFWISYAMLIQPSLAVAASYATANDAGNAVQAATAGSGTVAYNVGIAMYTLTWGLICCIYFICSLRTNAPFALIFFTLIFVFAILTGAYLQIAKGNISLALKLIKVAGGFAFVTCLSGIWIDISLLMASVGHPGIPVVDLSHFWNRRSRADAAKNV